MNKLTKYNNKRNFKNTKEPIGKIEKKKNNKLKYCLQHHIARKDHYDLRLEYNGVFVSFAIPKGPSFNPKEKRLAIKVEDHPLSYGNFEGTIKKGEYGAGTVMLFDTGYYFPYNNEKIDFKKDIIKFVLDGKRLKGRFCLVKLKDNNYLLIKEKDRYVLKNNIKKYKTSIKTNRTMKEISNNKKLDLDKIIITHPEKIIYEKYNIKKLDIINYYKKIANRMMPFLENRLISTVRCPNGINKEQFYMKHLNTNSNNIGKKKYKNKDYFYIKNPNGLIEEVQMNSIEFHIWGCKKSNINRCDLLVFDFDPDINLALKEIRNGVKDLKKILDKLKLKAYLKTSGKKGYHVVVPIDTTWKNAEKIALDISNLMVDINPDKYTTNIRKNKRENKIFIDYLRNKKGATSICPYSLRLNEKASISFPISFNDLNKIKPDSITIKNVDKYLTKNPWSKFTF